MTQMEFNRSLIGMEESLKLFANSLVRNEDEVNDLVQETYLKALKNRTRFINSDRHNLRSWLYTILKNTFINQYRRKKNGPFQPGETDYDQNMKATHKDFNPESYYYDNELKNTLKNLNSNLRVPLEMSLSGYKYREISDELNLKIGTVKSRIFISKKKLQKMIDQN